MSKLPGFNEEHVASILESARNHHADTLKSSRMALSPLEDGHLLMGSTCVSVTIGNGKACVNLPLGLGDVCVPVPSFVPNGTVAQACIAICSTWGIPHGVKLTVSVAGQVVVEKTFLKC